MILAILMVAFGITALRKGEFKITAKRKVTGNTALILGILLLSGILGLCIPFVGVFFQVVILTIVIIIGLLNSEPLARS